MAALAAAPVAPASRSLDVRERALALWPGLDRRKLQRTQGDPSRVARLVGRRTTLPPEAIVGLLIGDAEPDAD
jgi:hypothetical protein